MGQNDASQGSESDIVARLEVSREALMNAIEGLDEEAFRRRKQPGAWNAAEVLAHLLGNEKNLAELAQQALTADRPFIPSRDDAVRQTEARAAQRMAVPQIVLGRLADHEQEHAEQIMALKAHVAIPARNRDDEKPL